MFDTSQATPAPVARIRQDIALLGVALELGAGTRGTLMAPDALRTAGLARVLGDLGHRVGDRGTLHAVDPAPVKMTAEAAERCRHLAEIAGWTRRLHDEAHALAREGIPVFLGGDHSISMGTVSGVARACA